MGIVCNVPLSFNFTNANGDTAGPNTIQGRASGHSGDIQNDVDTLKGRSNELAEKAKDIIDAVANFGSPTIPDVTFSGSIGTYGFAEGVIPDAPELYKFSGSGAITLGDAPGIDIVGFSQSSFSKPVSDPVSFADLPPAPSGISRPTAPLPFSVDIPDPPGLDIVLRGLPDIGSAPVFSGFSLTPPFSDILPRPSIDLPLPDLSGLDRLEAAVQNTFERNTYNLKVLEEATQAAASFLSGNFIIDMDVLEAGIVQNINSALDRHENQLSTLWSRRGFAPNSAAAGFSGNVRERMLEDHQKVFDAALERWKMRLLPVAAQLSTEAHSQMVEIRGQLYDLDFEFLEAEHVALQGLYGLALARYDIAIQQIEQAANQYAALTQTVEAFADRYRTGVRAQRAVGDLNAAKADGYAAAQQAKEAEGDSFRAAVDAGDARVQAYGAQMRALRTKAQTLQARLLEYQAEAAEWSADLSEARNTYRENRANNRGVVARNRQAAAQMSADSTEAATTSEFARASATEALVLSANLRAESESQINENLETDTNNAVSALNYVANVSGYRLDAAEATAQFAKDRPTFQAKQQINSAVSGVFDQIASGSVRAAQLTQQYRIELAQSFRSLYDAVGRADAARVSGELSRYRASAGLRTRGSVDYSSQVSDDVAYSFDITNSKANSCRTEFEPGTT